MATLYSWGVLITKNEHSGRWDGVLKKSGDGPGIKAIKSVDLEGFRTFGFDYTLERKVSRASLIRTDKGKDLGVSYFFA